MGWDILALGLPAAGEGFDSGRFLQHLAVGDHWLERGQIDAADALLRQSPLGLAGHGVMGSLWLATGQDLAAPRRDALLDAAREAVANSPLAPTAGATSPHPRVVVLRGLAQRVEPLLQLFIGVRQAWRPLAWGLDGEAPRIWRL
jgi:urease accessory protein